MLGHREMCIRDRPHIGRWTLPGGRVERGELLAEAVIRELREETGVVGVCSDLLGLAELLPGFGTDDDPHDDQQGVARPGNNHFVVANFVITLLDPDQRPIAGSDASDVAWVPVWDVAEMDLDVYKRQPCAGSHRPDGGGWSPPRGGVDDDRPGVRRRPRRRR